MKKWMILFVATLCAFSVTHVTYATPNTWTQKTDFGGAARYAAVGFSIGSKGYIGTGWNSSYKKDFWEYDPVANTWTQKADFGGAARYAAVGFCIGDKGYIGTGTDLSALYRDFWEYDPGANSWTQRTNFEGGQPINAVGFSIGNKGYIGTGSWGSYQKTFWAYDPVASTWTQKADFGGTSRAEAVGFSIGTKGYIGIGKDATSRTKDFWEYDPTANTWTQKADFGGTARSLTAGFSLAGKGYIGAGWDSNDNYKKDFWEYDPAANTWTQKADFGGTVRRGPVGFAIGGKGYIGTGWDDSSARGDFWQYTPVSPFGDVSEDYWAYDHIMSILNRGYTTGTGAGTFSPESSVTREQMAAFIVRAVEGEPASDYCSTSVPFPDCTSDSWSCKYIKRLYELGLTTGYGTTGYFMPSYAVTREQMAAFLIRAIEGNPASNYCDSGSPFTDVTAADWSCIYIKRLYELGITTGYGDGTYGPYDLVTRAQMAVFLGRAFLGME